ncbi:hypothetical protein N0V90_003446 [Kalmusia sp. IMI 367209]|nr:hypothetical protein N0V90_003446 [Kalmusia sp. IMI 367209]
MSLPTLSNPNSPVQQPIRCESAPPELRTGAEQIQVLQADYTFMQSMSSRIDERLDTLQARVQRISKDLSKAVQDNAELQEENLRLELNNDELEEQMANLEQDNTRLQRSHIQLQHRNESLEEANQDLVRRNISLELDLEYADRHIDELEDQISVTNDHVTRLESQFAALTDVLGVTEVRANRAELRLQRSKTDNAAIIRELASVRNAFERVSASEQNCQRQIEKREDELRRLTDQIRHYQAAIQTHQNSIKAHQNEISASRALAEARSDKVAELEHLCDEIKYENERLKVVEDAFEAENAEHARLRREIEGMCFSNGYAGNRPTEIGRSKSTAVGLLRNIVEKEERRQREWRRRGEGRQSWCMYWL